MLDMGQRIGRRDESEGQRGDRLGSMSTVVFGRTYPPVERAGASACAKPS